MISCSLTEEDKIDLRISLRDVSAKLLGIKWVYSAEWTNYAILPIELDCSEQIEGTFRSVHLKMPDGAQNQFNFTVPTGNPTIGDLAFMGKGGNIRKIYHVGMVFDDKQIIEARAPDPKASFKTGCVILRPRVNWERWPNFVGYRSHPKLI